ncbi:MAG: inositol-3-phosphate synthase [Planctomycetia bacterium]|nr:inositol-3-phosphate synthase [Planctomycetia bacterium]
MENRTGIWFIGAWGGVAATATLGLLATREKKAPLVGLTTELPEFSGIPQMPDWKDFVIGGCEIRRGSFAETADDLASQNALDSRLVEVLRAELCALDAEIVPGYTCNSGPVVERMADWSRKDATTGRAMVSAMQVEMGAFVKRHGLSHLIVFNLMSTEPVCEYFQDSLHRQEWEHWDAMESLLDSGMCPLPASSLYAIAALEAGYDFVNFTPSLGATPPAMGELAAKTGARFFGNDGKTGETLMKSTLAPMFAHRNLEIMSWVGHNIFGNRDGVVLDDPRNKATKVTSKNHLLEQILGYSPQTLVTIEYIKSLGDWKTAWDHIHFRGFLGTPMTLQFTWQGCDSLLAAPLVLDLIRLTELARRRQFTGKMDFLACFFKSPIGVSEQGFVRQFEQLERWMRVE